jgi:transcriptional regulator with XRE-family HTH domain
VERSLEKRFGEVLAAVRRARGLSQEDLEGAAHRTYLSELERGLKSPTLSTIAKLAEALDVPPALLVYLATVDLPKDATASATADALSKALSDLLRESIGSYNSIPIDGASTLRDVDTVAGTTGVGLPYVLSEAALVSYRNSQRTPSRPVRDALEFYVADRRDADQLRYSAEAGFILDPTLLVHAVKRANHTMEAIHDFTKVRDVPIFDLLGMRNLSSFVGEVFKRELAHLDSSHLFPNPHQDGYPDLCSLSAEGRSYVDERTRKGELASKEFWSPFPFGGLEVKATCGNTPPAKKRRKRALGEQRHDELSSLDWKAHHRETNFLIGLVWDFIDGLPTVVALFFRNDLSEEDWGEIVKPRDGGGRTTSVSIMKQGSRTNRIGVKKMALGWIVLARHRELINALCRVLALSTDDLRGASSSCCFEDIGGRRPTRR